MWKVYIWEDDFDDNYEIVLMFLVLCVVDVLQFTHELRSCQS